MDTILPVAQSAAMPSPDAEDLEALFDRIAAERGGAELQPSTEVPAAPAAGADQPMAGYDVFQRVGSLTRKLHDALRELGYDKQVEQAVGALPDARTRLDYIARLTGQAAERVLAATEKGQELDRAIEEDARGLDARWARLFVNALSVEEFRTLALDSRAFLANLPDRAAASRALYTEIMVAQDFHDLTGQVIQRIVRVAQNLEDQLVRLLLETTPPERRSVADGFLNGPPVGTQPHEDVLSSQAQVDDLLESLGF